MDELDIRAEKFVFVEHLDAAKSFDLSQRAAGMLGDRQSLAAGELPFFPIDLRRRVAGAARRETHRQQAVVGGAEPLTLHSSDVVEVRGLLRLLLQIAAVAVRKARANTAIAQRP